nr:HNH endonuclease signature motif containing protein [Priestia flexa]WEZ10237.1 HNH endonuclease signature motif containing protein [Priestia flexa]
MRTDEKEQAFYKTGAWVRLRISKLSRDPLCQVCLKDDKLTIATLCHHITPVKRDWTKRLNISNLMSVCDRCHNKIHKSMND